MNTNSEDFSNMHSVYKEPANSSSSTDSSTSVVKPDTGKQSAISSHTQALQSKNNLSTMVREVERTTLATAQPPIPGYIYSFSGEYSSKEASLQGAASTRPALHSTTAPHPTVAATQSSASTQATVSSPLSTLSPLPSLRSASGNSLASWLTRRVASLPESIVQPVPQRAIIAFFISIALVLLLLYSTGRDWADGALHAALLASCLSVSLLLLTGARILKSKTLPAPQTQPILPALHKQHRISFVAALLLFILCVGNLAAQPAFHGAQAHFLEGRGEWSAAITQYHASGERAPDSANIARTYNSWGASLARIQHYSDAINKFDTVINNYTAVPAAVQQAQKSKIDTALTWGKQALQQKNYSEATRQFEQVLRLPYCQATCKAQVNPLAATLYYNQAQTLLSQQKYADAVATFKTIQNRFPNTTTARQIHPDLAKALLASGQQEKASSCKSALPTYQELAQNYADTPEGKQAQTNLDAPQDVTGHFTTAIPTIGTPQAALVQNLHWPISNSDFYDKLDQEALTTTINDEGHFTFSQVKQGSYALVWGTVNVYGTRLFSILHTDAGDPSFVATVGPLCPFDFGDLNQTIRTS